MVGHFLSPNLALFAKSLDTPDLEVEDIVPTIFGICLSYMLVLYVQNNTTKCFDVNKVCGKENMGKSYLVLSDSIQISKTLLIKQKKKNPSRGALSRRNWCYLN